MRRGRGERLPWGGGALLLRGGREKPPAAPSRQRVVAAAPQGSGGRLPQHLARLGAQGAGRAGRL